MILKRIRLLSLFQVVFLSSQVLAEDPVYFSNACVKAHVEAALGKTDPTPTDMLGLIRLDVTGCGMSSSDLTAIRYARNLSYLNLDGNPIYDISPLSVLTNLRELHLYNNQIDNVSPLSRLTNLTEVHLDDNQIHDLSPLSALAKLQILHLFNNEIDDVSALSGLTNLIDLHLDYNRISNITPLSALTNLQELGLGHNQISDLSPLSTLSNLRKLYLYDNQISDLYPISDLTNLASLSLDSNRISDVSALSWLIGLQVVTLESNQISDLSPLSDLTNLQWLDLDNNQISAVSALSSLTNLQDLYMENNQISNISALTGLTNLRRLYLSTNPLDRDAYCHDLQTIRDANPAVDMLFSQNSNVPGGVSASNGIYVDKVRITWQALCPGPERGQTFRYVVYRSDSLSGTKTQISGELSATSFEDTNVTQGVYYFYWVKSSNAIQFSKAATGFADEPLEWAVQFIPMHITIPIDGCTEIPVRTNFCAQFRAAVKVGQGTVSVTPEHVHYHQPTTLQICAPPGVSEVELLLGPADWTLREIPPETDLTGPDPEPDWDIQELFILDYDAGDTVDVPGYGIVGIPYGALVGETLISVSPWPVKDLPYRLDVTSSEGGSVVEPEAGERLYYCSPSLRIDVSAVADTGYKFVGWTGEAVEYGWVADAESASTWVLMNKETGGWGRFTLQANFEPDIPTERPEVSTLPADNITSASATLHGYVDDDAGQACQYRFRYRKSGHLYSYTVWTGSVVTGEPFAQSITRLDSNTTYYFNAQAKNADREGPWSNEMSFTTSRAIDPSSVHSLSVSSSAGGEVILPGEGSFIYSDSAKTRVTAQPLAHSVFSRWTGTAVEAGKVADPNTATTSVLVDGRYTLRAQFVSVLDTIQVIATAADDPMASGTSEYPFNSIQEAIEVAGPGSTVVVGTGVYKETLHLQGQGITVKAQWLMQAGPGDMPVLLREDQGPIVEFGSRGDCTLSGFTIMSQRAESGPAVLCKDSQGIVSHCLICGNVATGDRGAIIQCQDSNTQFINCTISGNRTNANGAVFSCTDSNVAIVNSIVWANTSNSGSSLPTVLTESGNPPMISYSDVQGTWSGIGNMVVDPLFVLAGHWELLGGLDAHWIPGDYHLISTAGRWDPMTLTWVQDATTSPCIDAGDPATDWTAEPMPNGSRINMGAYGGMSQASHSPQ